MVAFFGHDVTDSAVRRRVRALRDDGLCVVGFMMRRRHGGAIDWDNVELGRTSDGAYGRRVLQILGGARRAAGDGRMRRADVIYARNLDMLVCAFLVRLRLGLETPVVYECLDVHRLVSGQGLRARLLRRVERVLLRRTSALVVSSPGFLRHHFDVYHRGLFRSYLVENRLAPGHHGPRPAPAQPSLRSGPLRVGWVGVLRCRRSFELLCRLADRYPNDVEIRLSGLPSRMLIPGFDAGLETRPNMIYAGPYSAPEDLATIYGGLDLVWAGDFMDAGLNSEWLLPNRLYEGGWYGTPSAAPAGTETAAWIARHRCGFVVDEPLDVTLDRLVDRLLAAPAELDAAVAALRDLPDAVFVQPPGLLAGMVADVLGRAAPPATSIPLSPISPDPEYQP